MTQCRRCAECQNSFHHWIEDPLFDGEKVVAEYSCKHCDALGMDCTACEDFDLCERPQCECPVCGGDGIMVVGVQA